MVQPLWRTVWKFLKKLKIELPYDPAIPRLVLRQEIDGLQDRQLQLVFYLHFLRQEIDRLQDKHLQPATYICFKIEITGTSQITGTCLL